MTLELLIPLCCGFGVGCLYFLGLYWTILKRNAFSNPLIFVLASLLIRTSVVVLVFYWVGNGRLFNYGFLLIGFVVSRFVYVKSRKLT